ncbi:hypothetical protein C791_0820 [Amycolatopsis azurea DSM 43854]|uniref:Uncharacterized protein n=1 Tax=Amycolatopsis azurea DSM 43854 TaxID=1238180 RepID=M2Q6N7_9PSEU|nr:hypothetical protein C791_0820 [Amycolatopsis azurea DSM 43854]
MCRRTFCGTPKTCTQRLRLQHHPLARRRDDRMPQEDSKKAVDHGDRGQEQSDQETKNDLDF